MHTYLAALTALCITAASAGAATLEDVDAPHCVARLSGRIETGDSDRIADRLPRWRAQVDAAPPGARRLALCLDSPGGNLREATRIAALIERSRVGTVIDDGARCLSACSIIFMLGARDGMGEVSADIGENRVLLEFDRLLHVNGTLGFHRPAPVLKPGMYSAQDMQRSFDVAITAALEFMRIANLWKPAEGAPAMKSDLIEALLAHRGEDFFYIDTVDKAGRWDIGVFGYAPPRSLSAREALNACDNLSNWHAGVGAPPVEEADTATLKRLTTRYSQWTSVATEPTILYTPVYGVSGRDVFWHDGDGIGERYCQVYFQDWQNSVTGRRHLDVMACGGDAVLGSSFFEFCSPRDYVPEMQDFGALAVFPSATRLPDLPAVSRRIEKEAAEVEAALMPGRGLACGRAEGAINIVAPEGHVLLRARPDPAAPVVGKAESFGSLPRGSTAGQLVGSEARRADCYDACTAPDPDLQGAGRDALASRIEACFDDDVIWWPLRLRDGTDGWASARHLR